MTSMTKLSIGTGAALIALAVGFFLATGATQKTALIPVAFGIPILIMGFLAKDEKKRKMAAHIAVLIALLGLGGGFGMGIPKLIKEGPGLAVIEQIIMGVICLGYIIFAVKSFIAARKAG
ncbi:MAG: hypothetical protein AAGA58_19420 [Verrucomicrobiota bacterium]